MEEDGAAAGEAAVDTEAAPVRAAAGSAGRRAGDDGRGDFFASDPGVLTKDRPARPAGVHIRIFLCQNESAHRPPRHSPCGWILWGNAGLSASTNVGRPADVEERCAALRAIHELELLKLVELLQSYLTSSSHSTRSCGSDFSTVAGGSHHTGHTCCTL